MKKLFACAVWTVLLALCITISGVAFAEDALPAGTDDLGTKEVVRGDDETAYYEQLLEAEKFNYKILRNVPAAFEAEDYAAYESTASKAVRGNKLGDKQRKLLDETVEIRQNMRRLRSAEDTMWMLWPSAMPLAERAEDLNFSNACDNPGFKPYLIPYILDDQSAVKGNLIVVAGGAYSGRNNWTEGFPIVDAFNTLGYNCFLLQRRVSPYSAEDIWMDMQRSVRFVKHEVEIRGLAGSECIGAVGFSGGSMTILGSVTWYYGDIQPTVTDPEYVPDDIDAYSADLDVALCIYGPNPIYEPKDPYQGLITDNENLPAFFLAAGMLDNINAQYDNVKLAESVMEKTLVENHTFANVPHGFGIGVEGTNSMNWVAMADCFIDQAIAAKHAAD